MGVTITIEEAHAYDLSFTNCARCGGEHIDIPFYPLFELVTTSNGRIFTHQGTCPTTGEPVLAKLYDIDADRVFLWRPPGFAGQQRWGIYPIGEDGEVNPYPNCIGSVQIITHHHSQKAVLTISGRGRKDSQEFIFDHTDTEETIGLKVFDTFAKLVGEMNLILVEATPPESWGIGENRP